MKLTGPLGPNVERLNNLDRRSFGAAVFTAGYAAAVRPVQASAITTDEAGLICEEVTFPAYQGYKLPAYVARPDDGAVIKKRAAIVVVNEVFGIHAYIKDVCRRFAKQGYVAIAPDYFDRGGDPSVLGFDKFPEIIGIVVQAKYPQIIGDTASVATYLKGLPYVNANKLGITGFCWGGGLTWMACAASSDFKAGVAWYGMLQKPGAKSPLPPEDRPYPIDIAATLKAPVLGLYAEHDQGILLDHVEAMRAALKVGAKSNRAAKASKIIVYPGTEHGFHADYRPSYNAAAAKDGWAKALGWFKAYGVK